MKNNRIILIGFVVAGLPVAAVERPDASDGATAPTPAVCVVPETLPEGGANQKAPATVEPRRKISPLEKRQYRMLLGIRPGEVSPAMKAQLGSDGFAGVVVEDVVADSPAGKAGIQQYDIITKVADKPISRPRDIREALMNFKEGDKVPVELLRSCEQHTVELVLDHALKMANDRLSSTIPPAKKHIDEIIGAGRRSLPMGMSGNEDADDLYKLLMEQMIVQDAKGRNAASEEVRNSIERLRRMTAQMEEQVGQVPADGENVTFREVSTTSSGGITTFRLKDNKGVIEIASAVGQGTRLVVKDEKGNVVFEGPYSTDEDKAKVPENIRQRLKGLCVQMQSR